MVWSMQMTISVYRYIDNEGASELDDERFSEYNDEDDSGSDGGVGFTIGTDGENCF